MRDKVDDGVIILQTVSVVSARRFGKNIAHDRALVKYVLNHIVVLIAIAHNVDPTRASGYSTDRKRQRKNGRFPLYGNRTNEGDQGPLLAK